MTVCAMETASGSGDDTFRQAKCVICADGSYAARLVSANRDRPGGRGGSRRPGEATGSGGRPTDHGTSRFAERWTLDGPQPHAVPLLGSGSERPDTEVQPLSDGRVLVHRRDGAAGAAEPRHVFSLLYPTARGTDEVPLGTVECSGALRLLPPAPDGRRAYALSAGRRSTSVWLVAGGASGPERLAEFSGRCTGGAWLESTGRLLAVDLEQDGRTKAVTVDLERGEVAPLLRITEDSTDRLLLADPHSGLLLIRSDAASPGHERLAWGVLGSTLPVRFPECLWLPDCALTPIAVQPGRDLAPERRAVALRIDGAAGTWLGVWRPAERTLRHLPAPRGWLTGSGLWTADGVLHLPYVYRSVRCGLARVPAPPSGAGAHRRRASGISGGLATKSSTDGTAEDSTGDTATEDAGGVYGASAVARAVPLRQAPLTGRGTAG